MTAPADPRGPDEAAPGTYEATLVESVPTVLYTAEFSTQSPYLSISPQIEELTGHPPESFIGPDSTVWEDALHPDDRARAVAALRAIGEHEADIDIEYRFVRPDGEIRHIWERGSIVRDRFGHPLYVQGVMTDISRVREAEAALRLARDEALRASRVKTEFLATISHELRTPMYGVVGAIDLLRDTELDDAQRELLGIARQSADHLLVLIDDVLDLARIESGRQDLEPEPFALAELVTEVADIVAPPARAKGVEVTADVDPGLPELVVGDPRRVRQILLNLAGNAVKFTNEGRVRIGAEPGAPGHVRFVVEDTGPGIPTEERAHLFEPFWQGDTTSTRSHGGTGLGLAISARLVEAMGGPPIEVDDADGGGARFVVSLALPGA